LAGADRERVSGYIHAGNAAWLALHEKRGSARVGFLPGIAYRYGRWADSVIVHRSLGPGTTVPPPPLAVLPGRRGP
jgi:L-amino acid N-acyltransferase YncA